MPASPDWKKIRNLHKSYFVSKDHRSVLGWQNVTRHHTPVIQSRDGLKFKYQNLEGFHICKEFWISNNGKGTGQKIKSEKVQKKQQQINNNWHIYINQEVRFTRFKQCLDFHIIKKSRSCFYKFRFKNWNEIWT